MNRDPKVAEFLISQGLETTSSAEYNVLPSLGVYTRYSLQEYQKTTE